MKPQRHRAQIKVSQTNMNYNLLSAQTHETWKWNKSHSSSNNIDENSPFFTRASFPEWVRRTCLPATPTAPLPPAGAFMWCSESRDDGDFGDDESTSEFCVAIVSLSRCSSVKKPSLDAIYTHKILKTRNNQIKKTKQPHRKKLIQNHQTQIKKR